MMSDWGAIAIAGLSTAEYIYFYLAHQTYQGRVYNSNKKGDDSSDSTIYMKWW